MFNYGAAFRLLICSFLLSYLIISNGGGVGVCLIAGILLGLFYPERLTETEEK